jgi:hypothetical protein
MPPQRFPQRLCRARRIAETPPRRRQPDPRLPNVILSCDSREQRRGTPVITPEAGGCQRQPQCRVARCETTGTFQPPARLGTAPGGRLRLAALERLESERNGLSRVGQLVATCGSVVSVPGGGGRPAMSFRAS